ncbi:unnamed protein product [Leptosia nina]|uniref:Nucleotide exchange factor Fes1 domain-containing protein n=1 Tax=Leptosia nina TaxID=320188 RepID=A0AAV1J0G2_9NEOP
MDQSNENSRAQISGALMPANDRVTPGVGLPRVRNLQGLLRFAMEATRAEDAPGESQFGPMDEERRKFLEQALKSITVNIAEVLQNAIRVLTDVEKMKSIQLGEELPEDVVTAFENILSYIDDLDVANDFYKVGGFAIFPVCYGSENEEVRGRASRVLAELCQNNPFCQARALECGLLNIILHMLTTEQGPALAKCVSAISSATREFEPACREVVVQGGCEALSRVLSSSDDVSAKTRTAFLMTYLCHHYPPAKEKFIELDIVKVIGEQLSKGRDEVTEHLLSILLALVEDPRVVNQCQNSCRDLQSAIETILRTPELESFQEEKQYCLAMLKVLENCPRAEGTQSEADR